ncbi:hypothetical protein GGR52DRAFT_522678 [Hypoxylon sp. FL1284]|nr:hypothetical protein GGR52DRAFT_522678 [Hypoxylon sp. FL1284]
MVHGLLSLLGTVHAACHCHCHCHCQCQCQCQCQRPRFLSHLVRSCKVMSQFPRVDASSTFGLRRLNLELPTPMPVPIPGRINQEGGGGGFGTGVKIKEGLKGSSV